MLTIKSFGERRPLYNETYTQYGPSFYLLTEPLHSVLGLPLSQHAVRFKTAILWVISVLLTMAIVHRLSGNRLLALCSSCMVAIHLSRLALEPGHPQEISLVMSLSALWLVCDDSPRRWWMAGCCAALCGMCKLNVGFALTMPLLLAAVSVLPRTFCIRTGCVAAAWMLVTAAIGTTMLPLNLRSSGIVCTFVMLGAWMSVCVLASQRARSNKGIAAIAETMVSGFVVSSLIVVWVWSQGTSFAMLAWGMLGQHSGFARTFFQPIPVDFFAVLCSVVVSTCYRSRKAIGIASFVCLSIGLLKTASTSVSPLTYQIQNGAEWLALIGPCFAPALLLYRKRLMRGRVMLAGMTAIGPWIAFPIPGTQLMLGTIPAWMTLGVVASDFIQYQALADIRIALTTCPRQKFLSYSRLLLSSSCVVGALSSFISTTRWINGKSLAINGSEWIHLEPPAAELEQQIVQEICKTGAKHLVFDGHANSRFYFWTGLKPLTSANATIWPYLLSQRELIELKNSVEQSNSLCVVVPPGIPKPLSDLHTTETTTRQSLYNGTVFHFQHPSGWSIGIREK